MIADILPDQLDPLRRTLAMIDAELRADPSSPAKDAIIPFRELETIHFARWVIIPGGAATSAAQLVFATDFDGALTAHLLELVRVAGKGLDRVYSHCRGYPKQGSKAPGSVIAFLRKRMKRYGAFYVGHRGRSTAQIVAEAELREALQELLERLPPECKAGREVRRFILDGVRTKPELGWAMHRQPVAAPRRLLDRIREAVGFGFSYVVLVLGFLALPLIRRRELSDERLRRPLPEPDPAHPDAEDRNLGGQNEITHLVPLKPGLFRRALVHLVLWIIDLRARFKFTEGHLQHVATIHFARWAIIDDGRLLFLSNYDGSWQRYLGDFIDHAYKGMNAIWSNAENFPPTRFLFSGGVQREKEFKQWTRAYQLPTQVWYQAYPQLSVENINNDTEICKGLTTRLNDEQTQQWLRRL